jgi:hypothetical protein
VNWNGERENYEMNVRGNRRTFIYSRIVAVSTACLDGILDTNQAKGSAYFSASQCYARKWKKKIEIKTETEIQEMRIEGSKLRTKERREERRDNGEKERKERMNNEMRHITKKEDREKSQCCKKKSKGRVEVCIQGFLASVMDGTSWPGPLYSWGKTPQYKLDMRLVAPRGGLGSVVRRIISCGCRESNPDSQTAKPVV